MVTLDTLLHTPRTPNTQNTSLSAVTPDTAASKASLASPSLHRSAVMLLSAERDRLHWEMEDIRAQLVAEESRKRSLEERTEFLQEISLLQDRVDSLNEENRELRSLLVGREKPAPATVSSALVSESFHSPLSSKDSSFVLSDADVDAVCSYILSSSHFLRSIFFSLSLIFLRCLFLFFLCTFFLRVLRPAVFFLVFFVLARNW